MWRGQRSCKDSSRCPPIHDQRSFADRDNSTAANSARALTLLMRPAARPLPSREAARIEADEQAHEVARDVARATLVQ